MIAIIAITSLIVFVIILAQLTYTKQDEIRVFKSQDFIEGFSREIFFASEAQRGYVRTVNSPASLEGLNYVISGDTVSNSTILELSVGGANYIKVVPALSNEFVFDSQLNDNLLIIKTDVGLFVEVD
jgi:hypothetical protein